MLLQIIEFEFSPLLLPLLVYLATAGIKSVFGGIDGRVSMLVASLLSALLVFGESVIGGLGPDAAAVITAIVELILVIASAFGLHDELRKFGRRT